MQTWIDPLDVSPSPELQAVVGGHPLVATILARRGITAADEARSFLDPEHYAPTQPEALPGVEASAVQLLEAVERGKRILVWGDFDVDGQTSTALLVDALRGLGGQVEYYIPQRLSEGHGVFVKSLKPRIEDGIEVLLTCDVGISAHDAIDVANMLGVTTLITDHHALPPELPDADAIVSTQMLPPDHALHDLPGVGVAYKLMQYLYALAGRPDEAAHYLDLVALGIVADVATQRADTRYLLQRGLQVLRKQQRVGLLALIQSAGVDPANLSAEHIGFQLGPRLNALGRLSDANRAVELLTGEDEGYALIIAAELEGLNNRRKQISDQIYAAAQEMIASEPSALDFEALVLNHPRWHTGVIGIVASRLVEMYGKPVILLASPEGEAARGSARSVPGVDIGAAIAAQDELLIQHGGHPGAAGLSLDADLIAQFRRRVSNTIAATRTDDSDKLAGLQLDAEVTLGDLTVELAEDLERLAPFGAGNPAIRMLARELRVVSHVGMGVNKRHRRLTIEDDSGTSHQVVWWNGSEYPMPGERFDMVFTPRINDFRGRRSLQLEWIGGRTTAREVGLETGPEVGLTDLRAEREPLVALADFLEGNPASIWVEAVDEDEKDGLVALGTVGTRANLAVSPTLVVWTAPPGPLELQHELEWPAHVVVVGLDTPYRTVEAFLKRLLGLARYALREYDGEVSIVELAGHTGQREVAVRKGLEWLAAKGQLSLEEWLDEKRVRLGEDGSDDPDALGALQDAIAALLAEAAAYRAYFRRATLETLIGQ